MKKKNSKSGKTAQHRDPLAEHLHRKERRLEKQVAEEGLSKIGLQHEQELNRERIHRHDLERQGIIRE